MLDMFTRSLQRAVLATGFADDSYPLIRLHVHDPRFDASLDRLCAERLVFVLRRADGRRWYMSPAALGSLIRHSEERYAIDEQARTIASQAFEQLVHVRRQSLN